MPIVSATLPTQATVTKYRSLTPTRKAKPPRIDRYAMPRVRCGAGVSSGRERTARGSRPSRCGLAWSGRTACSHL